MSSGKAHEKATVILAIATSPFILVDERVSYIVLGEISGILLSPDLDANGWAGPTWRLKKLWKPLGWAWRALWFPYALCLSHRGISHWPIVGTLTRLLYLSPLLVLWAKFGTVPWAAVGLWAAGLTLSDLLHIMMDKRR